MIVVDASVAYALLDERDAGHEAARSWYEQPHRDLLTTPLVLAEVDHLAEARLGRARVRPSSATSTAAAITSRGGTRPPPNPSQIAQRYLDLGVSLTDASLVALAARVETTSIATFDERHFRAIQPLTGEPGVHAASRRRLSAAKALRTRARP